MLPEMARRPQFLRGVYDGSGEVEYIRADRIEALEALEARAALNREPDT